MLNQRLQQKLLQKLSPQQILLMKLLQIPAVGLEQRIKQEIEENPALDAENEETEEENAEVTDDKEEDEEYDKEDEIVVDKEEEFSLDDYIQDEDDIPLYKLKSNNYSADDEHREMPVVSSFSFHEILKQQLGLRRLDEHKYNIGIYIIGNIDDSGYLERSTDSIVDETAANTCCRP